MTPHPRIFFFHWHATEAATLASALRQLGYHVDVEDTDGARGARNLVWALKGHDGTVPSAAVISLARLPSHGRITAAFVRSTRAGADVPLIFVDGTPEKVQHVRRAVPSARFLEDWEQLPAALADVALPQQRLRA